VFIKKLTLSGGSLCRLQPTAPRSSY